jgi:hypothetical protein
MPPLQSVSHKAPRHLDWPAAANDHRRVSKVGTFFGGVRAILVALAGLVGFIASCSDTRYGGDDDDEDGDEGNPSSSGAWMCIESDTQCDCEPLVPGADSGSARRDACYVGNCCLLSNPGTRSASCTCFDFEGRCEAEARSRQDTRAVERCPPGAAPAACAAAGENCRPEYLEQQGLRGCCEGMLCRPNVEGVPVCEPVSPEEYECERVALGSLGYRLQVETPVIRTSVGEMSLDELTSVYAETGPDGCLATITISVGAIENCSLTISASTYFTSSFDALMYGCPGFTGDASLGGVTSMGGTPDGVVVDAVTCERLPSTYCLSGTFAFELPDYFEMPYGLVFEDEYLVLRGVICGEYLSSTCLG